MVIKEYHSTRTDGVKLYRTYSDEGKMLLQNETGYVYDEAVDVEDAPYTYTETDEPIGNNTNEATEQDLYNALAELGVSE